MTAIGPVPTNVRRTYAVRVCQPGGHIWPGYVEFGYYADDPYVLNATIVGPNADTEGTIWAMSRETMALAIKAAPGLVGIGDVAFHCERHPFGKFYLTLRGFDEHGKVAGIFSVQLRRRSVEQFLALTEIVCPLGSESLDVDADIAVLLGYAQP